MHRTIFQNATIADGTGSPLRVGDVCVEGERITEIAPQVSTSNASELIDCSRLMLAPGFIDVHTHDDAQVLREPAMRAKVSQGVTTVIVGNCGLSLVPLVTQSPIAPLDLLHRSQFRFNSMREYANAVNDARPHVNVGTLVGHSALRVREMNALDRPANDAEIARMQSHLADALDAGALGLSSGVFYAPAYAADANELHALTKVLGEKGGVYVTHIRNEMETIIDAMNEAAYAAHTARVPWILSHHKCAGPANWQRSIETLAHLDALSERQEIGLDAYPYVAGSTLLREDLVDGIIDILITRSDPHPEMAGKYLKDIAAQWSLTQKEAARKLMPGGACYFQMKEDDVRRILKHPKTMIGSDGLPHDERPHPRLWGTFPRVLSLYCRQENLFDLPTAIHKMTGLSAKRFKLKDRGEIRVGAFADLVLFDASTIQDRATFAEPIAPCEGIARVMVNGQWSFGTPTDAQCGFGRFIQRNIAP